MKNVINATKIEEMRLPYKPLAAFSTAKNRKWE